MYAERPGVGRAIFGLWGTPGGRRRFATGGGRDQVAPHSSPALRWGFAFTHKQSLRSFLPSLLQLPPYPAQHMSDSQLKITPKSEHVEDVSATEFGNANLAILHDEALMVAEGEEKMTGKPLPLPRITEAR